MTEAEVVRAPVDKTYWQPRTNIAWTASRCNRLLRPIAAKLRALQKTFLLDSGRSAAPPKPLPVYKIHSKAVRKDRETSEDEDEDTEDPDWGIFKPRKRVKHKYGTQPTSKTLSIDCLLDTVKADTRTTALEAGLITVATPMLVRTLPQSYPVAPDAHEYLQQRVHVPTKRTDYTRAAGTMDGLCTAVQTMLRMTGDQQRGESVKAPTSPRTGARSLFEACLRAVPVYIAAQEEDATANTYEFLEEHECIPGMGWPHLKHVVRSHCLWLIAKAIQGRNLTAVAIDTLTQQVLSDGNEEEFWTLKEAFVFTCGIEDHIPKSVTQNPCETNRSSIPSLINPITTTYSIFYLRCITRLLSTHKLSVLWFATQAYEHFWINIIRSLSQRTLESESALHFVETFLTVAIDSNPTCRYYQERVGTNSHVANHSPSDSVETALHNRVASLCKILVTIALADHFQDAGDLLPDVMRGIENTVVGLIRTDQAPSRPDLAGLVFVADLLFHLGRMRKTTAATPTHKIGRLISHMDRTRPRQPVSSGTDPSVDEPLSNFVSSLIVCYDRAVRGAGFAMLENIVWRLMDASTDRAGQYPLMKALALRSANAFAQQSKMARHAKFAQELEQTAGDCPKQPRVTTRALKNGRTQSARYRWEEGICEWVVATPARDCPGDQRGASTVATDRSLTPMHRGEVMGLRENVKSVPIKATSLVGEDLIFTPTLNTTERMTKQRKFQHELARKHSCLRKRHHAGMLSVRELQRDDDMDELSSV